jgi:outer membrane protein assembly factor BamB
VRRHSPNGTRRSIGVAALALAGVLLLPQVASAKGDGAHLLAPADGAVFAATPDGLVYRLDTGTGRVTRTVRVPGFPRSISTSGREVWVSYTGPDGRGRVARLDARTGDVERGGIRLGRDPVQLAATPGAVWALDGLGRTIVRMDARGGRISRTLRPARRVTAIAAGGDTLWIAQIGRRTPAGRAPGLLRALDARTGATVARATFRGIPRALAADADGAVLQTGWRTLLLADAGGGSRTRRVADETVYGVALDPTSAWTSGQRPALERIDRRSLDAVAVPVDELSLPSVLAAGSGSLWLAGLTGRSVRRIDPDSGRTEWTVRLPRTVGVTLAAPSLRSLAW